MVVKWLLLARRAALAIVLLTGGYAVGFATGFGLYPSRPSGLTDGDWLSFQQLVIREQNTYVAMALAVWLALWAAVVVVDVIREYRTRRVVVQRVDHAAV